MCDYDELNSPYEQLSLEQNNLADNINEIIPFSISDNSTGSEESQFMNKKRIRNKDNINKSGFNEQKDIESFKSQKCIELYEEEKKNYSENIKTKNKKVKKDLYSNATSRSGSSDRLDLLNFEKDKCFNAEKRINSKTVSKYYENENEYENKKLIEEPRVKITLKNKENPQLLISLNKEKNDHIEDMISHKNSKYITKNKPESFQINVLDKYSGNMVSENIPGNIEIEEKKSKNLQEKSEEKTEKIKEEQLNNDFLQDEENFEESYDSNYDPQSIFPKQSNELGNDDELLNISLSNVVCNEEKYNSETLNDDNDENVTI